jgi:hypothetical protein
MIARMFRRMRSCDRLRERGSHIYPDGTAYPAAKKFACSYDPIPFDPKRIIAWLDDASLRAAVPIVYMNRD